MRGTWRRSRRWLPIRVIAFEKNDICDVDAVNAIFAKYQPDAVVHLAAESHVDRSISGSDVFVKTNVLGTFTLLEAARRHMASGRNGSGDFRFVHVSTDEVYGSLGDDGLFTETTPYDPSSPYSATKAASDHLAKAWQRTYGLPVIVSNCSNNYGPYHFPEKLIPLMILNALDRKPLPVYGDGSNIRDWLFVEDHARALGVILAKGMPRRTPTMSVVATNGPTSRWSGRYVPGWIAFAPPIRPTTSSFHS